MLELLSNIDNVLDYIKSNSTNAYILKEVNIINIKLDDIRNKVVDSEDLLNFICDKIVGYDISTMKRVTGQKKDIYNKYIVLEGYIKDIKLNYFN